jgi:trimeric autotransporter adhesin
MGLMEPHYDPGRLVVTPHPLVLDGQRNIACDLRLGESLYAFLSRHVEGLDGEQWVVAIGGRHVERHLWHHVYPKHGQVIELRGGVGKTALLIVALIALTIFTAGAGLAVAAGGTFLGLSGAAASVAIAGVQMVGTMLINKVLGPKPPKPSKSDADSVYSLSGARNSARPYEPLPLLFGSMRIAPDLASNPYMWFEGNDQYLAMVLTPGINVDRVDALYNGDTLLTAYEGVTVWHNGFSGMDSEDIPLYSNADVVPGATMEAGQWIERTTSTDTIRIQVDIEYLLFDLTSKGKPKNNQETVQIDYRPVGAPSWQAFGNYFLVSSSQKGQRRSYGLDVARGQYEVRVRRAGQDTVGDGATCEFTLSSMASVQADDADYAGIPRIGIKIKATGQLSGSPDLIRCVAHSKAVPVWKGTEWVNETTSNPGAQILAYARGITDENGKRIAGIGLNDQQIDIEALQAFMLHCTDNGYTYNYYVKDARTHEDVVQSIALAGFGQITWAAGRLSVVWAADEQPLSGVVNMATIKRGQFQVDYALVNAADGIEYTYLDGVTWETKTLRVTAPGVTTMLNPARLTGEGVTTEAHAAQLARYHLAQSLYQYKDVSYSTDIEHLSYRRMSLLALQHDLTQWGYGGRVMGASILGDVVTLYLDEPVPAPPAGNAFIGLRIPGERVYRVFPVQPFSGTSQQLVLAQAWPVDAPLPGATAANPAHDTIWIYDFKQTPGYRVRVVGIEPEKDLSGASVSVVPEPPEFWVYVKTGEYLPPADPSLLITRPIASNLQITEAQTVQGDTVFTELSATFDITGPVGNVLVSMAGQDGVLEEVAQTTTRTATWRIPSAGTYTIVVRPYNPDGVGGIAASIIFNTSGADAPPVLIDTFNVQELSGGVRKYTWSFFEDTIQSADFAGVEIRYIAGNVPAPVWGTMAPLGDAGYHAAAFEAVLPTSGEWTFACRSRNTSGTLSVGARVITKTLGKNLGEIQEEQEQFNDQTTQEILDLFNADAQLAFDMAEGFAEQAALIADLEAALTASVYDDDKTYEKGDVVKYNDGLYVAKEETTSNLPSDTVYWTYLGAYSSLAEAVGAQGVVIASHEIRIEQNEDGLTLVATQVDAVALALGDKADTSAVQALQSEVNQQGNDIDANSQAITSVNASLAGIGGENLLANSSFDTDSNNDGLADGWTIGGTSPVAQRFASALASSTHYQRVSGAALSAAQFVDIRSSQETLPKVAANQPVVLSVDARGTAGRIFKQYIQFLDAADTVISTATLADTPITGEFVRYSLKAVTPANTVKVRAYPGRLFGATGSPSAFLDIDNAQLQIGTTVTAYSPSVTIGQSALSTAVSGLSAEVATQGANLTATANALTAVKSILPSGGGNLLYNSSFETDLSGWTMAGTAPGRASSRNLAGDTWRIQGTSNLGHTAPGVVAVGQYIDGRTTTAVAVRAGATYIASVWAGAHRSSATGFLVWIDAAGAAISTLQMGSTTAYPAPPTFGNTTRIFVKAVAPANAVRAAVYLRLNGTGETNPYAWFTRPMLEEATTDQAGPSAYNESPNGLDAKYASAVTSLETRVTGTENGVNTYRASWTLALDVNGYVTGASSVNNGTTSTFTIVADKFNIVSPGGGARTEYSGGNWRAYDPNGVMRSRWGIW